MQFFFKNNNLCYTVWIRSTEQWFGISAREKIGRSARKELTLILRAPANNDKVAILQRKVSDSLSESKVGSLCPVPEDAAALPLSF